MTTPTVVYCSTAVYTLDRRVNGSMCAVDETKGCPTGISTACTDALKFHRQDSGLWYISTITVVTNDSADLSSLAVFVSLIRHSPVCTPRVTTNWLHLALNMKPPVFSFSDRETRKKKREKETCLNRLERLLYRAVRSNFSYSHSTIFYSTNAYRTGLCQRCMSSAFLVQ